MRKIISEKDGWKLESEYIYDGLSSGVSCLLIKNGKAFPVIPNMKVMDYDKNSNIFDAERDMPTQKENDEHLDECIERFKDII